jgi:hypothetical protein
MDMDIKFRPLVPSDLELVVAVEAETLPPAHRRGLAKHFEEMTLPHVRGHNYSFGAFDGQKLVGYLLGYVRPSTFKPGEQIVWALSFAVLPEYRPTVVAPLLDRFLVETIHSGFSVEGKARESTAFRMLVRHPERIERPGYKLTTSHELETVGDEHMIAIRLDPINVPSNSTHRGLYWTQARFARSQRMLYALPRRTLRFICYRLPRGLVPTAWLRATYLMAE